MRLKQFETHCHTSETSPCGKISGSQVVDGLKAAGYMVYPVNPNVESIYGDKCYADLDTLPEVPDVIDMVVPPKITKKVVEEAKKLGIKKIWLQPGSESEDVIEYCEKHDISVLHHICVMVERRKTK